MKRFLPWVLLFVSVSGMAAQGAVTKTDTPNRIISPSGSAVSVFTIVTTDLPRAGKFNYPLRSITWNTTGFPQRADEIVEICYRRAHGGGTGRCVAIAPNSSGTLEDFNDEIFFVVQA